MNAHDRTDPRDELGRRAAAALRTDVDRRVDVDAALARVLADDGARVLPLAAAARACRRRPTDGHGSVRPQRCCWSAPGSLAFALSRDDGHGWCPPTPHR